MKKQLPLQYQLMMTSNEDNVVVGYCDDGYPLNKKGNIVKDPLLCSRKLK